MFQYRAWYDAFAGKVIQCNARTGDGTLTAATINGAVWGLGTPSMNQLSNFILPPKNEVLLLANACDAVTGLPLFIGADGSIGDVAHAAHCVIEPCCASPLTAAGAAVNIKLNQWYVDVPAPGKSGPLPLSAQPPAFPWILTTGTSMFTLTLPPTSTRGLPLQFITVNAAGTTASKSTLGMPTVWECLNSSAVCVPILTTTTARSTTSIPVLSLTTPLSPAPTGSNAQFTANLARVTINGPLTSWQQSTVGAVSLPNQAFTLTVATTGSPPALVDVSSQGALALATLGPPSNLPLAPFVISAIPSACAQMPAMLTLASALGTMPFYATPALSTAALAGIIIGSVLLAALIVVTCVVVIMSRRRPRATRPRVLTRTP